MTVTDDDGLSSTLKRTGKRQCKDMVSGFAHKLDNPIQRLGLRRRFPSVTAERLRVLAYKYMSGVRRCKSLQPNNIEVSLFENKTFSIVNTN